MESKWKILAEAVLESAWLIALATVPLHFNILSMVAIEGNKAALLRSLALLMLPFLAVWLIETRERLKVGAQDSFWRFPLIKPALIFAAVFTAATVASIAPRLSFFGFYHRLQGLYTSICYLLIFLAVLLLAKRSGQVERIVYALLLAGLASSLYGILQYAGFDPHSWSRDFAGRVGSTLGNPIFLGSFLIMVMPITVARAWRHVRRLKSGDSDAPPQGDRRSLRFMLGVYTLLLLIQLAAFLFCRSTGPLIGLAAGTAIFLVILVVRSQRRWIARSICGITALVIVAFVAWGLSGGRRDVGLSGKLATTTGTVKVRLLIWEGATKLLASNPRRLVLGYGPETLYYTFTRFYPPKLASSESRIASPDRCHNATFDSLLMIGVVGLCAELALLLALLASLLIRLDIIDRMSGRTLFFLISCLGGAAGWLAPYFALGNFQLSGIGAPAGILTGMAGFLLVRAGWGRPLAQTQDRRQDPLLLALLIGVVAHFIEIQFGIGSVTVNMYFWAFAGLAGALVHQRGDAESNPAAPAGRRENRLGGKRKTASSGRPEMIAGAVVGSMIIVLTFCLYEMDTPLRSIGVLLVICLAVWIVGAVLAAEQVLSWGTGNSRRFLMFRYAAVSLGPWLLFAAIYLPWMRKPDGEIYGAENLKHLVNHLANGVALLYSFVFLMFALTAYFLFASRRKLVTAGFGSWWKVAAFAVLAVPCCIIIQSTNVDFSRADVLAKQAFIYEGIGQVDVGLIIRSEVLRLRPDELQYRKDIANALTMQSANTSDPVLQRKSLEDALPFLLGVWGENKAAFDGAWNLAAVYRMLAQVGASPSEQTSFRLEAEKYYRAAIELFPSNVSILNDWASFYLEEEDPAKALELLDRSRRIDDGFDATSLLLGKAHAAEHAYSLALADYDRALALAPQSAEAREGRAAMLRQLQQSEKAPGNVR